MTRQPGNPLLLFLTIGLGIAVYAAATRDFGQATLAIPVWLASWFVSYGPGGVALPRAGIVLAVLGTTAYMLLRLKSSSANDLIHNISTYLLWLQLIKLYDRTAQRDLSQLLVMSFALVVGACLQGSSILFGALLLLHATLGMLCAATLQFHAGFTSASSRVTPAHRVGKLTGIPRTSRTVVTILIVSILALASGLFVVLPRGMETEFIDRYLSGDTLEVSFDDEVQLGADGLLSDSQEVVLDISIKNGQGKLIETLTEPVYLRGAVLDTYQDGRWTASKPPLWAATTRLFTQPKRWPLNASDPALETYTQHIEIHNKHKQQLFTMPGLIRIDSTPPGRVQWISTTQLISMPDNEGRVSYTVVSQPLRAYRGRERALRLPPMFLGTPIHDEMTALLSQWQLARDQEVHFTESDTRIAKFLESHLRNRCRYTTELIETEPDEDPIEMFLFRTREGHCEYFASSMAAMLRSIGMDARVVTGYIVRESRIGSNTFVARKNDAHAWVEVQHTRGLWTTYDPSPPSDVDALRQPPAGFAKLWSDMRDSVMGFWARSVIGYDQMRQKNILGDWTAGFEQRVRNFVLNSGQGLATSPLRAVGDALLYGVIAFTLVGTLGFGSRLSLRQLRVWLRARFQFGAAARGRSASASFQKVSLLYRKAERRLRRAGFDRPLWMTPQQFARSLGAHDSSLAAAMQTLASLHYRALFSPIELDASTTGQAALACKQVDALAGTLGSKRKRAK